jgi:hypothetical protein
MLYFRRLFQLLQWTGFFCSLKKLTISFVSISENWRQNQNGTARRRNPESWLNLTIAVTSGGSSALLFPFSSYFWPQFCSPGLSSRNAAKPPTDLSFFPSSDTSTDRHLSKIIIFHFFFKLKRKNQLKAFFANLKRCTQEIWLIF